MTSLIGTVMPYAERGHVCVRCMVLCVDLRVPGGQCVSHITCRDSRPVPGLRNVDSYYTHFSFAFWTICRCNASKAVGFGDVSGIVTWLDAGGDIENQGASAPNPPTTVCS